MRIGINVGINNLGQEDTARTVPVKTGRTCGSMYSNTYVFLILVSRLPFDLDSLLLD